MPSYYSSSRRYHPYSTTSNARYIRVPSSTRASYRAPVVILPPTRAGLSGIVVQPNQSRLANLLTRYGQAPAKRVSARKPSASATKAKKARLNKLSKAQLIAKLC